MAESDHNNTGMDDERDEKLGFVTITPPNAQADRIRKMSCNDLKSWICTLNLTGVDACAIAHMLSLELVDGETFLQMTWEDMAEIGIPFHTCHELDLAKAVTLSVRQSEICIAPSSEKACLQNLEEHDRSCVYGCLLTLGYKSYRVSKGVMCTPVGPANDMFTLDCQKSSVAHSVRDVNCMTWRLLILDICRLHWKIYFRLAAAMTAAMIGFYEEYYKTTPVIHLGLVV